MLDATACGAQASRHRAMARSAVRTAPRRRSRWTTCSDRPSAGCSTTVESAGSRSKRSSLFDDCRAQVPMPKELIGVIGAGTMGAGIAEVALEHGHEVVLHDVDEAAIGRGIARIRAGLGRRAAGLGLDADTIDDWVEARLGGLRQAESLDVVADEADL